MQRLTRRHKKFLEYDQQFLVVIAHFMQSDKPLVFTRNQRDAFREQQDFIKFMRAFRDDLQNALRSVQILFDVELDQNRQPIDTDVFAMRRLPYAKCTTRKIAGDRWWIRYELDMDKFQEALSKSRELIDAENGKEQE